MSLGDINDKRVQRRKLQLAGCWGNPLKRNLGRGSGLEAHEVLEEKTVESVRNTEGGT
jgi:hypothetical protein